MASPMKEKFFKYWEECSLLLAVVVVLDPRFKLDLVKYYYARIYGSEANKYIHRIRNCLVNMFTEHGGKSSPYGLHESGLGDGKSCNTQVQEGPKEDKLSDFHAWYLQARASNILSYQK